jgi:maltose O-acetyltransferase
MFYKLINYIIRDIPIHFINIITIILPNNLISNKIRGVLIKPFLGKCGKRFQLGRGVIINNPGGIILGDDCYISHYCYIQAKGKIIIGNNVIIGPMSVMATSNHIIEKGIVAQTGLSKPIEIGDGTWCGAHVIITSGVKIGKSVIVGAGAVVTKDIRNNCKVYGVPARDANTIS